MQDIQNIPNPDVNSPDSNEDFGSHEGVQPDRGGTDIEKPGDGEAIPVPPDQQPPVPIEDPPGSNEPPVGDVNDSPEIIAEDE
jgi:hypothetical protein